MTIYTCVHCRVDNGGVSRDGCYHCVHASEKTALAERLSWDQFFMSMAELTATRSKDPSTKVGAVIVDYNRRVIGLGYNGFPRGVDDRPERYTDKKIKYSLVVHAEANAIVNSFTGLSDTTIYTTMFPCSSCTKLIIQSGISRVVCPPPREEGVWSEDANFSKQMLREALVFVYGPDHSWQLHNDTTKSGRFL